MMTGVMVVRLQKTYIFLTSQYGLLLEIIQYYGLMTGLVLGKVTFILILAFWIIEISSSKLFKKKKKNTVTKFIIYDNCWKFYCFKFLQFHVKNGRGCTQQISDSSRLIILSQYCKKEKNCNSIDVKLTKLLCGLKFFLYSVKKRM